MKTWKIMLKIRNNEIRLYAKQILVSGNIIKTVANVIKLTAQENRIALAKIFFFAKKVCDWHYPRYFFKSFSGRNQKKNFDV